jgi:hypothetical protein
MNTLREVSKLVLEDPDFIVLHGLALRRRSDIEGLEQTTGLAREVIEQALDRARKANLVALARRHYLLTADGDAALGLVYPQRFAESRGDRRLAAACERFESLNREFKALITDWQVRPLGVAKLPNDHSDAEYDDRILQRLSTLHDRAEEILSVLSSSLPLVARHVDRLRAALQRAEGGEPEWVSGVRCDSYHAVWFELHEDLLRLLGKSREEDR